MSASIASRWSERAFVTALLVSLGACTTIDGGAVELSWRLRPSSSGISDKFVGCTPDPSRFEDARPVARIRLDWEVAGQASGFASWPCEDNHGVTGFDLAAGDAFLTVSPECDDRVADARTFIAPAPIERPVSMGHVVSLGAIELILNVSGCGSGAEQVPCICQ